MKSTDMEGRVCLVTGAGSGIGRVTAHELADCGATVVVLGRNAVQSQRTVDEIRVTTGNDRVELLVADLGSLAAVVRAAQEFQSRYEKLHVLIHNAGGIHQHREISQDGLELTFAVNYLAPVLLTRCLLPLLKASAPARIIHVSSDGHRSGRIDFDDLQSRSYGFIRAYAQSKLAQIYHTYELALRLTGSGVTVNALHPGLVASGFNRGTRGILHWIAAAIYRLGGISEEAGAKTTLYLATATEVQGVTGKYFDRCRETASSPASYDPAVQARLWEVSERLLADLGFS